MINSVSPSTEKLGWFVIINLLKTSLLDASDVLLVHQTQSKKESAKTIQSHLERNIKGLTAFMAVRDIKPGEVECAPRTGQVEVRDLI